MEDKNDKKLILKAFGYLDALIMLFRMRNQFAYSMDELSERFHNLPKDTLSKIFDTFCGVSLSERNVASIRSSEKLKVA